MKKRCSLTLAVAVVLLLMAVPLVTTAIGVDPPPRDGSEGRAGPNPQPQPRAPSEPVPEAGRAPTALTGYICFQSDRDGVDQEIYRMNADGTGQTRLTHNPAEDYTCAWAPDGSKLLFVSERDGNPEVYSMNPYGGDVTRLTDNMATDIYPEYSPDGTKIVFASTRGEDGHLEIFTMNADGSGVEQLTFNTTEDSYPSWSPNGAYIAFSSERDGVQTELYRMNADGSAQTRLTYDDAADWYPQWSPDSTKILFYYRPGEYHEDNEVWRINADGTGAVQLTSGAGPNWAAVYSPDGRYIAFSSLRDGGEDREIYVMNADGSGQVDLTNRHDSSDLAPYWIDSLASIGPSLTITLTDAGFTPEVLGAPVGAEVVWYNATGQTHILQSQATGMVYLPVVLRSVRDLGASATGAGRPAPIQAGGALWARGSLGTDSFSVTLAPGATFAHVYATEGDYHYRLASAPYFAGLVTVVSREAYCHREVPTVDLLKAAHAALAAGATSVSLSANGCVGFSRTLDGGAVTHEELTVDGQTVESWDHTTYESTGWRDGDMDGFAEWQSSVNRGDWVEDEYVVRSTYAIDTHYLARRETYDRLSEETMRVVWEEDFGDGLTLVGDFETSAFDVYSGTVATAANLEDQDTHALACTPEQENQIRERLAEAVQKGVECLHEHGRYDLGDALAANFAKKQFDIDCQSCSYVAQIEISFDPTVPAKITVCEAYFAGDANWQRSSLFHELEHLSEPPHDPAIENNAGDKNWEIDPIYACESLCFNPAATKCSCATCLQTKECDPRCGSYQACNPVMGAKCLCPSRPMYYPTLALCTVDCPSGIACFASTCKAYDVSCP